MPDVNIPGIYNNYTWGNRNSLSINLLFHFLLTDVPTMTTNSETPLTVNIMPDVNIPGIYKIIIILEETETSWVLTLINSPLFDRCTF